MSFNKFSKVSQHFSSSISSPPPSPKVRGAFAGKAMTSHEMDERDSGDFWDYYYDVLGEAYRRKPFKQAGGRLLPLDMEDPETACIPIDNCPFDEGVEDAYAVVHSGSVSKALKEYCVHNLLWASILKPKQIQEVINALHLQSTFSLSSDGVSRFASVLLEANKVKCNAATYFADTPLFSSIGSSELNLVILSVVEGNMLQVPLEEKWKLLYNTLWTMLYGGLPGTGRSVIVSPEVPASIAEDSTFVPCVLGQPFKRMNGSVKRVWALVQSIPIRKPKEEEPKLGTDINSLCLGLGWPCLQASFEGLSQASIIAEKMSCAQWCADKGLPPSTFLPLVSRHADDRLNLLQIAYNRGCRIGWLNAPEKLDPEVNKDMVPKNAVSFNRVMKYEAGHELWYGRYGMMVKMFLLFSLFMQVSSACVSVANESICNLNDWISKFGQEHSSQGAYRVCFDSNCILRYRVGSNKKADPDDPNNIFPYRCPSPDWEPKISNSSYEDQCIKCKGHVHGGFCEYGFTKRFSGIKVIVPNDWNLLISDNQVTFAEFQAFSDNFSHSGGEVIYKRQYDHPHYEKRQIKWMKLFSAILSTLATILTITVASGASYKVKLNDDEIDIDEDEVKVVNYKRVQFPKWLIAVSFTVSIACCFISAAAAIDTGTLLDTDVQVSGFNLPSECSCSNPGDIESQLRCVTSCDADLQIDNIYLKMAFGTKVQCEQKYLVILQQYHEVIDKACFRAGNEAVLQYYCQKASYCEIMEEGGLGYSNFDEKHICHYYCAFGYNLYRYANWKLTILPAQMCYYNVNPEGGIVGLPIGINYTSIVHSDLVSQNVVLHVVNNGVNHIYKVTNGQIGSDRAWVVSPQCIVGGNLSKNCWLHQRLRGMVNGDRSQCGTPFDHLLPAFTPTTLSDACVVDVQFNNMRCFMANKLTTCKYSVIGNVTMCEALDDGMIEGHYVGKGKSILKPDSWKKCGNCTASKDQCDYPWEGDEECIGLWFNETFEGNVTEYIGDWAVIIQDVSDTWTWVAAGISAIVVIIIVIILIIQCGPSCMMRSAMRSVPLNVL